MLRAAGVATAILVLLPFSVVHAASWQKAITLPMTVEYDSNPRLDTDNQKAVTRTIIAPDYSLVGAFGRDELRLGMGLHVERSSDQSVVLNREDPSLQLGWQRESETGGFGLTARYVESSTLSSALEETGVVASDGTQKKYALAGNWHAAIGGLSTLTSDTEYASVNYDIDSLTSYDEVSTSLSWNYAWSARVEPFTRFAVSRYEPKSGTAATASSNNYSPTAGVLLKITERLEGTLRAGASSGSGAESGARGQGGFELHYIGERFDTSIDAGRSTVTSGEGGFVEITALRGAWSYVVDETSRAGIDASWQDSKGRAPNTLRQFGVWASRELSPLWVARLALTYKQRQQDGLPDASANIIGMTLIYSHPDF